MLYNVDRGDVENLLRAKFFSGHASPVLVGSPTQPTVVSTILRKGVEGKCPAVI